MDRNEIALKILVGLLQNAWKSHDTNTLMREAFRLADDFIAESQKP